MIRTHALSAAALAVGLVAAPAPAFDKPQTTYKVFQFPQDRIPRIDGDFSDWDMVPDSYVVGQDQMTDQDGGHHNPDKTLTIRVKVGWVKGLNRLYFLYEAKDDYWDFSLPGLHNDTFEVVVDADLTGTPLIDVQHQDIWKPEWVGERASRTDPRVPGSLTHWYSHGVQAQNYHIMTPRKDKDWAMAWGSPTWIKDFPFANSAQSYNFKPGQGGTYRLEFYITPFDYAGPEGPERAVESKLRENALIALGWIVIDYDDVRTDRKNGFWSLSSQRPMFALGSDLPLFRLMPVEPQYQPRLEARWSWKVVDMDRRLVAFHDDSVGEATGWHWDFGDGTSSTERHPIHAFAKAGSFVTILDVTGPSGTSRRSKVWDVQLR
ncbi:PKD domain-containing protein [Sphingomonas sp. AP4-R1]|nr:PKD domain-containing protein [Sphingomonas sp. AP4-R1]